LAHFTTTRGTIEAASQGRPDDELCGPGRLGYGRPANQAIFAGGATGRPDDATAARPSVSVAIGVGAY
jgi:hypothetical protein